MLGGITLSTFTISRNFDNELRFPTGSIPLGIRQDCLNLYNLLRRFQNLVVTTLVEFPPLSGYTHTYCKYMVNNVPSLQHITRASNSGVP